MLIVYFPYLFGDSKTRKSRILQLSILQEKKHFMFFNNSTYFSLNQNITGIWSSDKWRIISTPITTCLNVFTSIYSLIGWILDLLYPLMWKHVFNEASHFNNMSFSQVSWPRHDVMLKYRPIIYYFERSQFAFMFLLGSNIFRYASWHSNYQQQKYQMPLNSLKMGMVNTHNDREYFLLKNMHA